VELAEVIPERDIRRRVAELGRRISADYQGRDLVMVGILNGAFVFAADLARAVAIPLRVEFLKAASYGAKTSPSGPVRIDHHLDFEVQGKELLVVEDIVDTGRTLAALLRFLKQSSPASLKVCAFLDKRERRSEEVVIDYYGFVVERGFLVGYGLDYAGQYRHLPSVYRLQECA